MKKPQLHLPEDIALEYANGNCSEAVSLAAAAHLTFCPHCRAEVANCERLAEAMLESLPGAELAPGSLEAVLARLDEAPELAVVRPPARPVPEGLRHLPEPVQRYLAEAHDPRWRMLAPGVKAIDLPLAAGPGSRATARLVRFRPGFVIPLHDHAGPEYTVVFSGAIEEDGARGERGDVLVRATGERHVQRVTDDDVCVALVVNEGPLVPLTFKGRLLKLITGV